MDSPRVMLPHTAITVAATTPIMTSVIVGPGSRVWDVRARSCLLYTSPSPRDSQDPVPQDASEARRLVTVQQKVLHPDGATTPLERITATVELKRTGETWKVASYQYRSVGE